MRNIILFCFIFFSFGLVQADDLKEIKLTIPVPVKDLAIKSLVEKSVEQTLYYEDDGYEDYVQEIYYVEINSLKKDQTGEAVELTIASSAKMVGHYSNYYGNMNCITILVKVEGKWQLDEVEQTKCEIDFDSDY